MSISMGKAAANAMNLTEEDFRAFVGSNANAYWSWLEKSQIKKRLIGGFVWTAFFLPLVWLAYRKLYLGIAIFIAVGIAFVILQDFMPFLQRMDRSIAIGMAAAVAVAGRTFVAMRAANQVAKADEAGLTGDARRAFLADHGGTSWISALLAGIFTLGFAGWIFYLMWGSSL
jgi:hypothetical protein